MNDGEGCTECGAILIPCKSCGAPVRAHLVDMFHIGVCACGVQQDEVCPVRVSMSMAEERQARERMIERSNSLIGKGGPV